MSSLDNLIATFSSFPGLGPRSARRLVFYLLKKPSAELEQLAHSLINLKKEFKLCQKCFNIAENSHKLCSICRDSKRQPDIICVVENITDLQNVERARIFSGLYHVLGGNLSTNQGQLANLTINQLLARFKNEKIKEVILALDATTEGDTTALYLAKLISPWQIKTTRLGRGLATGTDLEYADEITLKNALAGRS